MKTLLLIPSVIFLSILLSSCSSDTIVASDEITTKEYSFSGYTALEIQDNFNVFLTFSDTDEKFKVEANDNLHGYIKTTQVGNKLIVKLVGVSNIKGNETLNVYITTKEINDIKLEGNSHLTMEDLISSANVKIDLSGNCFLNGSINVQQMDLISTGNCMVDLSGNVKTLNAKLNGNCELSDYTLTIEDLILKLSGNSNAHLEVTNTISIDASGNSNLFYKGDASIIHQNLSSNSKIIKV